MMMSKQEGENCEVEFRGVDENGKEKKSASRPRVNSYRMVCQRRI
jgi:hypothetical protein